MKKLKIILESKIFLIIVIFLLLIRLSIFLNTKNKSIYSIDNTSFICTITNISNNKNLTLDCNEILDAYMYKEDNLLNIGDIIKINGKLEEYDQNKNFNLFNYKNFQNNRGIYYKLIINNYKKIGNNKSIIFKIKSFIINRIKNLKTYSYLKTFILGDKSEIDNNILDNYKKIGIIHIFSISGMHVALLIDLLNKFIKRNSVIIIFLIFYYELIKSISLFRCLVFYLVKLLIKKLGIDYSKIKIIFLSIVFILILKPFYLKEIGFYYSTIISSGIYLLSSKTNKRKNKHTKVLYISFIAFILSLPLNIYTYYEVNLLSLIYNIIFIPVISIIIFPLSLITFIFPFLDQILLYLIKFLEYLVNYFSSINLNIIFMKPAIYIVVIYYTLIILFLYKIKYLNLFIILIFMHYNFNFINKEKYILTLDVGQGDSILFHLENNNILLDTGGIKDRNYISRNITLPMLKSLGIRKLNYLIITHGDFDHMGEAINLVNNFKVEKVIFNCGHFNDLEQELIKVLDKKKIKYYSCIKELNIDNNKLYFLQTKEYDNENDNSNVIYMDINGYKFMFMGDASITTEKEIMEKYNLPDIDALKVGHHGSKTSSCEEFINEMNPKYSIISVGKKNHYGHPNKEVLENLEQSKIYRTDQDGSIMFKIKNNKLKIETCTP